MRICLAAVAAVLLHAEVSRADEARATLHLETAAPDLVVSSSDRPPASGCLAPCDVEVRRVGPELVVVRGREPLVVAGLPSEIKGGESFQLDFRSPNALRWIGGTTLLAGVAGGTVLIIAGVLANPIRRCDGEGCYTDYGAVDAPLVVSGSAVLVVSMLVGVLLLSRPDRVTAQPMSDP